MLLRICLIVAILAGIGTFVVGHIQVQQKIDTITQERDDNAAERDRAREAESRAKAEAKTNKEAAEKLSRDLAETTANLEATTARANTQQNRADKAETELNRTRGELTTAQRDLRAWEALGRPVDQIERALKELIRATAANEALGEEKKVLIRNVNTLKNRLAIYEGERIPPPELPPGLKGTVVAVDPKWDFVVLDIGEKQGLVERGELLVSRGGRLVAKLRVTKVEAERSVANVLAEWKQSEIMEGDQVLH
ncbi:MAG: hypothetical protein FJ387_24420 [Verrucomicrobia bacterium]|nr:hypothetical protein [Verrucomicrobiota bacterium]